MKDLTINDKFISLCRSFRIRTSIEVGAHEASFSNEISFIPGIVSVIAFEASPFVWDKYRARIPEVVAY